MKNRQHNANGVTVPAPRAANTGHHTHRSEVQPTEPKAEKIASYDGARQIYLARVKKPGRKGRSFQTCMLGHGIHEILEEECDCRKALYQFLGQALYALAWELISELDCFFEAERKSGQTIDENDPDDAFFSDLRDQIDCLASGIAPRGEGVWPKR